MLTAAVRCWCCGIAAEMLQLRLRCAALTSRPLRPAPARAGCSRRGAARAPRPQLHPRRQLACPCHRPRPPPLLLSCGQAEVRGWGGAASEWWCRHVQQTLEQAASHSSVAGCRLSCCEWPPPLPATQVVAATLMSGRTTRMLDTCAWMWWDRRRPWAVSLAASCCVSFVCGCCGPWAACCKQQRCLRLSLFLVAYFTAEAVADTAACPQANCGGASQHAHCCPAWHPHPVILPFCSCSGAGPDE